MILKTASLSPRVQAVIQDKGTEQPFTGEYNDSAEAGTYLCRQCGKALFRSHSKFHSGCGWPSFDGEIPDAIARQPDLDGNRTEILCARCQAHLGHVFFGEGLTTKNIRHCVNSVSLDFVADLTVEDTEEGIFAGGCFWGVEYYFKKLPGVLKVESGYTGGYINQPDYQQVCTGITGHYEAVRVIYDIQKIDYESLARYFFEIHDPTQTTGQGPDLGQQYLSAVFYYDKVQKNILLKLAEVLQKKSYVLATQFLPVTIFWPAEPYHQDYYEKTGQQPYCHRYVKRF